MATTLLGEQYLRISDFAHSTSKSRTLLLGPSLCNTFYPFVTTHVSNMMGAVSCNDSDILEVITRRRRTSSGEDDKDDSAVGVGEEAV